MRGEATTMPDFCVNKNAQDNGDHEVHDLASTKNCLPDDENQIELGFSIDCFAAIEKAKLKISGKIDGCFHCCNPCHKS